jgi:hypothetical protein
MRKPFGTSTRQDQRGSLIDTGLSGQCPADETEQQKDAEYSHGSK